MSHKIATDTFGRFERLSFVSRRTAQAGLGGEHRSRRRAPSTDFADYRPYQPGDDFRRVDWNVYGRLGTLQVKLTEARERLELVLAVDCSASMACGEHDKLAFAANLAAALGFIGLARSDAVRLVALRQGEAPAVLGPLQGRGRVPDLVGFCARQGSAGHVDLNAALAECASTDSQQLLVVLISDLLTPDGIAAGLDALLSQRADGVVLHVFSPWEEDPRLVGEIELVDAETEERLELGASLVTLDAYRARYRAWLAEQQAACTSRGFRYVRLSSTNNINSVILDNLRQAHVLR
ncbi:MAG TPA: DUF58 domain-containing protein [Chloroflexota bacterium]|jgi:uncharacterized protein (DUF58 family)|nr:DUF58 domain-containing protein [Chloroflexota bacterium]